MLSYSQQAPQSIIVVERPPHAVCQHQEFRCGLTQWITGVRGRSALPPTLTLLPSAPALPGAAALVVSRQAAVFKDLPGVPRQFTIVQQALIPCFLPAHKCGADIWLNVQSTRLALQLILAKGFKMCSFQLQNPKAPHCYFLSLPPRVGIG